MTLIVLYLVFAALVTAGFGIAYLVASERMARMVGIAIPTASARADYRAIYGGSQVAIGAFFALGAAAPAWRAPTLAAVALFALGFGVVRCASLAADGAWRDWQWIVGALEVLAGAIGALLYFFAGPQ